MADRIDGFTRPPQTQSDSRVNRSGNPSAQPVQTPSQPAGQAQSAQRTDSVSLTESARQLSELASEASSGEAVDMGRVEMARQAIDDGTYNVDPRQIAERLLSMDDTIGE